MRWDIDKAFAELRSILHSEETEWISKLLQRALEQEPEIFGQQWLPYLHGNRARLRAPVTLTLDGPDMLRRWVSWEPPPGLIDVELVFETDKPWAPSEVVALGPALRAVTSLRLNHHGLGEEAHLLFSCEHLEGLVSLSLRDNHLRADVISALASSEHLRHLRHLDLSSNPFGDEGIQALSRSYNLPNLTTLDVTYVGLGAHGTHELMRAPWLPNITELKLLANDITDDGAGAFAQAGPLPKLRELNLRGCRIEAAGAGSIAHASALSNLDVLHLDDNELGDAGILELSEAQALNPRVLVLYETRCSDVGARAIANSTHLDRLQRLHLGDDVGDEGVIAFAESKHRAALEELYLGDKITEEGAEVLRASTRLENLSGFSLRTVTNKSVSWFRPE